MKAPTFHATLILLIQLGQAVALRKDPRDIRGEAEELLKGFGPDCPEEFADAYCLVDQLCEVDLDNAEYTLWFIAGNIGLSPFPEAVLV